MEARRGRTADSKEAIGRTKVLEVRSEGKCKEIRPRPGAQKVGDDSLDRYDALGCSVELETALGPTNVKTDRPNG